MMTLFPLLLILGICLHPGASYALVGSELTVPAAVGAVPAIAIGDVTGEGIPDVFPGVYDEPVTSETFYWLNASAPVEQAGDFGVFGTPLDGPFATDFFNIVVHDLDADGDFDVVVHRLVTSILVLENVNGALSVANVASISDEYTFMTAADLSGNGLADIVICSITGEVAVAYMSSSTSPVTYHDFIEVADYGEPAGLAAIAASGTHPGMIVVTTYLDSAVLVRESDSVFSESQSLSMTAAGRGSTSILAQDINGDGIVDLVGGTGVWHGDINGSFVQVAEWSSSSFTGGLAVVDANLDGNADVIGGTSEGFSIVMDASNSYWATVEAVDMLGTMLPTEASAAEREVFAADFDGDGDLDVVAASCDYTSTAPTSIVYFELWSVPFQPTLHNVTSVGLGTAKVCWTAGPDNGASITAFTVSDGVSQQQCLGDETCCVFVGVSGGVFQVRGVNAYGEGPWSNVVVSDCFDGVLTGDETDIDCGGSLCSIACGDTAACLVDDDCASRTCDNSTCVSCSDGELNQDETDVDCGGICGATCYDTATCLLDDDCASNACESSSCVSCSDGELNQDETDVDCGGTCGATCSSAASCRVDADCINGDCNLLAQQCASCEDGILNGGEIDIDCEGPCTLLCPGSACVANADCVGGDCEAATSACATCDDAVLNGDETDVDCGGSCGTTCAAGATCAVNADCVSGDCETNSGACASCFDGYRNGDETCVDGGGSCISACADGDSCWADYDCASDLCVEDVCISCSDGMLNGNETCIDGGGSSCSPCADGGHCWVNNDCVSKVCDDSYTCVSCADGVLNQNETCVDGGGSCGSTCSVGDACLEDDDCETFLCLEDSCSASAAPDAVTDLTVTAADASIIVVWSAPLDGGLDITSYVVTVVDVVSIEVSPRATNATVTGLTNGVAVSVFVTAFNAIGSSTSATVSDVVPQTQLEVTVDNINTALVVGEMATITIAVDGSLPISPVDVTIIAEHALFSATTVSLSADAPTWSGTVTPLVALGIDLEFDVQSDEVATPDVVTVTGTCADLWDGVWCDGCIALYYLLDEQCLACPESATCSGGTDPPQPLPGFFSTNAGVIEACVPTEACAGGFGASSCTTGYSGPRCAECETGTFYRNSGVCEPCPDNVLERVLPATALLMFVVVVLWWVYRRYRAVVISVGPPLSFVVDFAQVVSMMATFTQYPSAVSSTMNAYSALNFNLDLLGAECAGFSYEEQWFGIMGIPIALALLPLIARALYQVQSHDWTTADAAAVKGVQLTLLLVTYLAVTTSVMEVFDCVPQESGGAVMDAYPSQYCVDFMSSTSAPAGADQSMHELLIGPAFVFLVLFVLGIPAYFALLLYWRNKDKDAGRAAYETLFQRYRSRYHWWLLVTMLRKLLMATTKLMFSYNDTFQLSVMSLITVLAWILQTHYKPFAGDLNALESAQLGSIYVVLLSGVVFVASEFEEQWKTDALTGITLVLLVGCMAYLTFAVGRHVVAELRAPVEEPPSVGIEIEMMPTSLQDQLAQERVLTSQLRAHVAKLQRQLTTLQNRFPSDPPWHA